MYQQGCRACKTSRCCGCECRGTETMQHCKSSCMLTGGNSPSPRAATSVASMMGFLPDLNSCAAADVSLSGATVGLVLCCLCCRLQDMMQCWWTVADQPSNSANQPDNIS